MLTFEGRNVNVIYGHAVRTMRAALTHPEDLSLVHRRASRYGPVTEFLEPVTSTYLQPWECVLLDPGRNANPWLHMMEALWCLAGRNDVAFGARYASKIATFSDDGVTRHGAYGHRWRHHFDNRPYSSGPGGGGVLPYDQLETCVRLLQASHDERRSVLTMWDPPADLGRNGVDLPCNTHVYLKVRQGKLIATVCCRSNDMVWGAYGSNAVEFAFLMAYVAARLGVPMGALTQVSDSLHAYDATFNVPNPALLGEGGYPGTLPLCDDPGTFIKECEVFCNGAEFTPWGNSFFPNTAGHMRDAWVHHKAGRPAMAMEHARAVASPDWRAAAVAWLERAAQRRAKGGKP